MKNNTVSIVILIAVGVFVGGYLYNTAQDARLQMYPELRFKDSLIQSFEGMRFGEVFANPHLCEPVVIDKQRYDYSGLIIPDSWRSYYVQVNSATRIFSINGSKDPSVVGIVGLSAFDSDFDYSARNNSVIEYDSTNGTNSSGDIVYLFDR